MHRYYDCMSLLRGFTTRFYYEVLLRPFHCPLLRQTRCPLSQRVLQHCLELPGCLYGPSMHITSRYNAVVVLVDPLPRIGHVLKPVTQIKCVPGSPRTSFSPTKKGAPRCALLSRVPYFLSLPIVVGERNTRVPRCQSDHAVRPVPAVSCETAI